jgi:xanthine dehydrogenase YagT iron-sulfur-binding subunit
MATQAGDHDSKSGYTRRQFLRGSGAAAAATALATGPGLPVGPGLVQAQPPDKGGPTVVRGQTHVTLSVNGASQRVAVEPRTTLLDVLRNRLNLTGAKPVSSDASSGASTVLVDGKPISASTMLAIACVGKKIQTVESLGGAHPDPVPLAFVHQDAEQCGFCTPGFVVAVRAFLNQHPNATEAEIRAGLNGNICRCGTYANIIQAAIEVVTGGKHGR